MSLLDRLWHQGAISPSANLDADMQAKLMQLITTTLGLQVRPQDEATIAHKLKVRSHSLGLPNLNAYYTLLLTTDAIKRQNQEWRWLIECLTTTESYFFRDKGQFSLLRHQILPELIARKRQQATSQHISRPSLRFWSAGCSSGEEAYSLAILLRELLPDYLQWNVTILGTDINQTVLEQAETGIYSNWSFRALEPTIQQQYFQPHREGWQIRSDIRSMVTFQRLNLVQDTCPDRTRLLDQIDLITCRNVFIYFQAEAIAQVLQKFYATLNPQGYLLTGHTELQGINLGHFRVRSFAESVIYQRPETPISHPVEPQKPSVHLTPKITLSHSAHHSSTPPPLTPPPPTPLPLTPPTPRTISPSSLEAIRALILQRNYGQAIQNLQHLLKIEPNNGVAHYLLAQVYANSGQHDQAIAACQKAMQIDSLSVDPCYLLAQIREEQGDLEGAKILYKRIIYVMPESIHAYLELAALYAREGNRKKALSVWQSALDLVRRSPYLAQEFAQQSADIADLERHLKSKLGL